MAATPYKFDAFLIDSEIDTRMRLRQATSSVPQFGKVAALNTLREALQKMQMGGERCDVIFVSCRFPENEITDFVRSGKETKFGQDAAYVMVLNSTNQDSSTIANSVMIGVDGFLFEPYSVDQLVEITNLAAKVKRDRSTAREKVAITLLVTDIVNQVDLVSYLKALGHEPGTSIKKLRELTQPLTALSPESFQLYIDIACNLFGNAPVPKRAFKADNYKGASSRVKKKMGEKIVAEAEAAAKVQSDQVKNSMKS